MTPGHAAGDPGVPPLALRRRCASVAGLDTHGRGTRTPRPRPGRPTPLPWDGTASGRARTHAVVAADDTNRIVAVSARPLDMLGYAAAADLAGNRLVEIVPFRFRQAHLAASRCTCSPGDRP